MSKKIKKHIWLVLFAVAMGYLEASVVLYLRELYCPAGFSFPLSLPPVKIFLAELGRELSTLIILLAVAIISGSSRITRFAYFSILFGIWDIFYYFGLYLFLKWPSSFFTWDILFSIPVSWASPVLAPLVISFLLIGFGIAVLYLDDKKREIKISLFTKAAGLLGLLLIFLSMTIDAFLQPTIYLHYAPVSFHWGLFSSGIALCVVAVALILKHSLSVSLSKNMV